MKKYHKFTIGTRVEYFDVGNFFTLVNGTVQQTAGWDARKNPVYYVKRDDGLIDVMLETELKQLLV